MMPKWLRENGLSIVMFSLFAIFLAGQGVTGWRSFNSARERSRRADRQFRVLPPTGHFVEATFENWESEFLQMGAFVVLTVWLVQKGSAESKPVSGDLRA